MAIIIMSSASSSPSRVSTVVSSNNEPFSICSGSTQINVRVYTYTNNSNLYIVHVHVDMHAYTCIYSSPEGTHVYTLYMCMCFSKPSRLPVHVYTCIYNIVCILVQLIHLHVRNSILLVSPFLRLLLLSLFPFLSNASVLYTYFPCRKGSHKAHTNNTTTTKQQKQQNNVSIQYMHENKS